MSSIGPSRVFVDSNVLMSRTLTDWLCLLSLETATPPYRVYWSEDVLADVIHHTRKQHPEWDGARISVIRDRFVSVFEGGRVGDFVIDGSYAGSDPHDAHVHAAAVACDAAYLLTGNVRDFPGGGDHLAYEVIDPDSFFVLIDDGSPGLVRAVTRAQMTYWARRRPEANLPHHLERAGCPAFCGACSSPPVRYWRSTRTSSPDRHAVPSPNARRLIVTDSRHGL